MSAEIIPFNKSEQPKEPMATGEAFCIGCSYQWLAIAPLGTVQLECPACSSMKGIWKWPHKPAPGMLVRECNCGNQLFYLTPEGHCCANCGTYQCY